MELKDLTIEMLQKERPELLEEISGKAKKEGITEGTTEERKRVLSICSVATEHGLSEMGKNPSLPVKFALGIFQLGLGFLVTMIAAEFAYFWLKSHALNEPGNVRATCH